MESFMPRSRQWGGVVSVLFVLLALARARQQSEVESDVLRIPSVSENIYTGGPYSVARLDIPEGENGAPLPLLIAAPKTSGKYPVVQFQHGWLVSNTDYSQLLHHLASYGFIAVAPQIHRYYNVDSNATSEISEAASVINWLKPGLDQTLSHYLQSIEPELDKLAVVGHSRGGKVVFGLATGVSTTTLKFSAIVGLDPVDGLPTGEQTSPRILHFIPHDLKLGIPTLIVGGGLSSKWKQALKFPCIFASPPCGPSWISHQQFFNESDAPAFHFVAPQNGHNDYLNNECPIWYPTAVCCFCNNGPDRQHMRNFSAGITVAFLQAYLNQERNPFCDALINYKAAPVRLDKPDVYSRLPPCDVNQEA